MVDALQAAHRVVRRGGVVIDARPDASRRPRIVASGRVRAYLCQCPDADERDARADAAVRRLVGRGLFRPRGTGLVWHSSRFADLRELDEYVSDSARYCDYERGTRGRLLPFRRGPLVMRRAIKFSLLDRL